MQSKTARIQSESRIFTDISHKGKDKVPAKNAQVTAFISKKK